MKNLRKKVIPITGIIMFIVFLYMFFFLHQTVSEPLNKKSGDYYIWLASDPQISSGGGIYDQHFFSRAVDYVNKYINPDVAFIIGDEINGYPTGDVNKSSWNECKYDWEAFNLWFNQLHVDFYKNYTIGNHDLQPNMTGKYLDSWKNMSDLKPPYGNYTYQFGNILFVVMNPEDQVNGTGIYRHQITWFEDIVKNNQDKNIVVLTHHPLKGTVVNTQYSIMETKQFKSILDNNTNIVAWFCGHNHFNGGTIYKYKNTVCIDCDAINGQGDLSFLWSVHDGSGETSFYELPIGPTYEEYPIKINSFNLKYSFKLSEDNVVISKRYVYSKDIKSGTDNILMWAIIPPVSNIGQETYINKQYLYGTFSWEGKQIASGYGWSLQGLSDLNAQRYIGFEKHFTGFRAFIYNKTDSDEHGNVSISHYMKNETPDIWNSYKIIWKHNYISFFINDVLVFNTTSYIPNVQMYFQIQACSSGDYPPPPNSCESYVRNINITGD